ncbi:MULTISPECIES: Clp protease N-terminal domain-containing protein [unclassified Streptomyces]|uniref:Clp protease N-terminal domain-containing protein n=1 Tax=unclassified Streptomyces TaxID=2593676 RepID=UPI0037F65728
MFERFTQDARSVVTGAVGQAERTGTDPVAEEHLLLALLEQRGTRASFAFAALGLTDRRASIETALTDARRRGGLSRADEQALAGLGIDLGEIVAKVERAHGEGAMRPTAKQSRRRLATRAFTPAAKAVLVESLRIAQGRRDRRIGAEYLLLALAARPGVAAEVLADHGATYAALERAMFGEWGEGGLPTAV